ncbi:hypothetical protein PH235_07760 [Trichococcus sp. K1Tr]|uniref:hypothetical protein n=1 Tax=Trichococcus sp. K1Tr TaxID=3020847 RepID=UPI00233133EB|nr:hypothetical protein [Trichococcus sp. K1Tr]MDB6353455.1 hypothetical protein [Trichococcus sp. K1Tr]
MDILLEMKQLFDSWDGTAMQGIKIIEKNQEHTAALQRFDSIEGMSPFSKSENDLLIKVIQKQKLVLYTLRNNKEELLQQAKQVNQKSRIIESYLYLKKTPVFVDRGM